MLEILLVLLVISGYFAFDHWYRSKRIARVSQKYICVTGCDSGFGYALARRLDNLGCRVFAGCLTDKGVEDLTKQSSSRMKCFILDLRDPKSINDAYEFVSTNLPNGENLHALVNNAGAAGPSGPVEFLNQEHYLSIFQVNFFGLVAITNAFLPLLKRSRGRIINNTGVMGFLSLPMLSPALVASKFAVRGYTDLLRQEKKIWGIKVSCIQPGFFRTDAFDMDSLRQLREQQWNSLSKDTKEEYGEEFYKQGIMAIPTFANKLSTDFSKVVDAYEHALFSTNPRIHYLVGRDAIGYKIFSLLPSYASDLVLGWLNPTRKPAALIHKSQ